MNLTNFQRVCKLTGDLLAQPTNLPRCAQVESVERARVIVTPVILVGRERPDLNGVIAECNRGLQELASSTGAEWLDVNAVLCPQGYLAADYTLDGMHLNAPGYEQVCRALLPDLSAKITD